jgi:hypothetical protein
MWKGFFSPIFNASICTLLIIGSLHIAGAQVMESTNYSIQSDSINFGGGFSSSSNYRLESTAGEAGTGIGSSTNYSLRAGYQQMQEVYIAITGAANVSLSPSIPGVTGGTANGSTTVTVTTDSPSGYSLTIAATQSPAMQKGGDSIADYIPSGDPDFTFTTGPADAHLGYTPEGADIVQRFKDDGDSCNAGSLQTAFACWDGLSTIEETISSSPIANHPLGATTSVRFRVGVGGSVVQPPGLYTATTTLTALPL